MKSQKKFHATRIYSFNEFKPVKIPMKPHWRFKLKNFIAKDLQRNSELYLYCLVIVSFCYFMIRWLVSL